MAQQQRSPPTPLLFKGFQMLLQTLLTPPTLTRAAKVHSVQKNLSSVWTSELVNGGLWQA